jgi:periplasmic protein TonB
MYNSLQRDAFARQPLLRMAPCFALSFSFHFALFFALAAIGPKMLRHIAPPDFIMVDLAEIPPKAVSPPIRERAVQPEKRRMEAEPVKRSEPPPGPSAPAADDKTRAQSQLEPVERRLPAPPPAANLQPATGIDGPNREQAREMPGSNGPSLSSFPGRKPTQSATPYSASSSYVSALKSAIEKCREYPLMARRQKLEGDVKVACLISREGELREARVVSTSGHSILDNAALRTVRSVGRFPPAPLELKGESFNFVAPITFRLNND